MTVFPETVPLIMHCCIPKTLKLKANGLMEYALCVLLREKRHILNEAKDHKNSRDILAFIILCEKDSNIQLYAQY
jgi:hypothetical protein